MRIHKRDLSRRLAVWLLTLASCTWVAAASGQSQDPPTNPLRQRPPKTASPPRELSESGELSLAPPSARSAAESGGNAVGTLTPTQIYELTASAQTLEQYERILHLCQEARQRLQDQPAQDAYLRRLAAWAFNRRGEAWIAAAGERLAAGDNQGAADADRRALADFEAAIEADPERWKALHNRGVSLAIAGQLEQAARDFDRVLQLQPQYVNAWFNRAEVRYELRRYGEAEADYAEVLQRDAQDPAAWTGRAHCRFRTGRTAEAVEDYSQVIQLRPEQPEAYVNRGEALQVMGRWEQAATDFRQALELEPSSFQSFQSVAWFMATCPEARYRSQNLALQMAEKAVALAPEQPQCLDTLAAAYANAGDFARAAATAQQALELLAPAQRAGVASRLDLYRQNRAYRQNPGTDTAVAASR